MQSNNISNQMLSTNFFFSLIGGGKTSHSARSRDTTIIDLTRIPDTAITSFDNVQYPQNTQEKGVLRTAVLSPITSQWRPPCSLPTRRGNHPVERLIPPQSYQLIRTATQQAPTDVIAYLKEERAVNVTAKCIRELISYGSMTRDTIINTFLAVLCAEHNLTFLSTFFIHIMRRDKSWITLQNWFAPTTDLEKFSYPSLASNTPILIPCHVNGAHWVGVVRRVYHGTVYFMYADDLNLPHTEQQIRWLLQTYSSPAFYPQGSIWLHCKSVTYQPHSNECGPRTLFALAAMALHPTPTEDLLLSFMHPNLAQILRTWVASALVMGQINLPTWHTSPNYNPSLRGTSIPTYLFNWPTSVTMSNNLSPTCSHLGTADIHSAQQQRLSANHTRKHTIKVSFPQTAKSNHPPQVVSDLPSKLNTIQDQTLSARKPSKSNGIQLTLYDAFHKTPPNSQDAWYDEVWGHHPEQINDKRILRIVLTNPRGLNLSSDLLETEFSMGRCQALGVGALCVAESNLNWGNPKVQGKFYGVLRKIWRHTKTSKSYTKEGFTSENQPGGTVTMVCNNWTSRVIEEGVDPFGLGRWSYIVLRGKGSIKILLITAYRVCQQTVNTVGPKTSTAQQFRVLSEQFREANRVDDPIPRHQFIVDLQGWIEHMVEQNYQIILGIDANESFTATSGNYTPVDFTLEKPIPTKGHDGTLATLVRTCGLRDPLLLHHTETPPPPTYDRGHEKIDFIFVSTSLTPSVIRTGIFPYNSLFVSDHRPCYIDLDGDTVFKEDTPVIEPPQHRGLRLQDPRLVDEYIAIVLKQLRYHNILGKSAELLKAADSGIWTAEDTTKYERIDQLLSEAMLYAERSISKKISKTYTWSPKLKAAIQTLTYWKLRLSQLKGKAISSYTLAKVYQQTKLPSQYSSPLMLEQVIHEIRQARKQLKEVQKKHVELREQHLEDLAEAIILHRRPHLLEPGKEKEYNKKKQKEIRRIQRKESLSRIHRKIGYTLKPTERRGGLRTIDIPHSTEIEPFPEGPDPKTWDGPWRTINDPSTIAKHICAANSRQYHQAHNTPCGREPLASYLGYKADAPGSKKVLDGENLPPELAATLLPETLAIFRTLQSLAAYPHTIVPTHITLEQFNSCYKAMDERTSSSPSGRHLGHYKAATLSEELATVHSTMMSIPLTAGFSPSRWRQIIDVMLEKKPGDHRIHRLRIVALQESDFNQSNRLTIGRPLQSLMETINLAPDMQHGSRASKLCHSAVLNKQLTFEIHKYTKQPIVYIENDAVGCYDRIMNPLILLFLRILGLSPSAVASLAATWESAYHRIRTLYGISKEVYSNTSDRPLYGPGQGSTIGPFLWLLCFILIFLSIGDDIPQVTLSSVNDPVPLCFIGEAFVDDTGLGTNKGDNHQQLISNLQTLAQRWEKLLYSTGGALNPSKCFWFLLSWRWVNGKAVLHTSTTAPGNLQMTSEGGRDLITIPRITAGSSFRTLGVHISPSGSNTGALKVLTEIVLDYCAIIKGSSLTRQEALISYIQYLLPKLRFQPPVLSLTQSECDKLTTMIMSALLPKLHVNRHTARSIIFGPESYGGLSLPNLYITQGTDKLRLFLGHLRTQDRTGKLIHIDMTYVQLLTGSGTLFLNQPECDYKWLESGWLQSLWSFTSRYSFAFLYPKGWTPTKPRENDQFIMEAFIRQRTPIKHMRILNRCRLYLQVITLSDITTADGLIILPEIKQGIRIENRPSTLQWPTQGDPPQSEWRIWRQYLHSFEHNGKLLQPLGQWIAPSHQHWCHFLDPATGTVYDTSRGLVSFSPLSSSRVLRSGYWYDSKQWRSCTGVSEGALPATIVSNSSTDGTLFQVKTSQNSIPPLMPTSFTQMDRAFYTNLLPRDDQIPYDQLVEQADLHISVTGYPNEDGSSSSVSWTFHSNSFHYSSGNTQAGSCTRYRAVLRGILSVIYVLYRAEQEYPDAPLSTVTLQCSHKKALKEAFRGTPVGVTTANQINQDLILDIRYFRNLLRTDIKGILSQEIITGQTYPIQTNPLNIAFVQEPSQYNLHRVNESTPITHVVTLVHDKTAFTGDIRTKIHELEYQEQLKAKIQKDNDWTNQQFQMVDWPAYFKAFRRIPRSHRVSIMKLSHQLWNTNIQNEKYYGHSNMCPICQLAPESPAHVYKCSHPAAATHRKEALSSLSTSLTGSTPPVLQEVLLSGLTQWICTDCPSTIQASTEGSRLPPLRAITAAFKSQTTLGWDSFHRGHIVSQWKDAYKLNYRPKKQLTQQQMETASDKWSRLLITAIWTYSERLWSFRNQVVHGRTEVNTNSKEIQQLKDRADALYRQFETDPHMIPSSRNYLFHRPLSSIVAMGKEALAGWIRSVEEGLLTRAHRDQLAAKALKRTLHYFFSKKAPCKNGPVKKGSIWDPPFSNNYYHHYKSSRVPKQNSAICQVTKQRAVLKRGKQKKLERRSRKRYKPNKSLFEFGFQVNKPLIKVSKYDSSLVSLEEYSGTRVSTAP